MDYAYVYILTNSDNRVLYTGVTSNLPQRIQQHRNNEGGYFTARYNLKKVVYCEPFQDIRNAISREKQIKNMSRTAKVELISRHNPAWRELMPTDE